MPKFRKKPVVIEARQLSNDYDEDCSIVGWCGGVAVGDFTEFPEMDDPDVLSDAIVVIHTLEGDHYASPGDWIIKGTAGEFYPCKPEIFKDIYEAVDSSEGA